MRRMARLGWCSVILALGLLATGCGSNSPPITENPLDGVALTDVGEAYRAYTLQNKRPPANQADLIPMETLAPTGIHAIKVGDVIVRYGATLPDLGEEPGPVAAPEILAYQKQVPEQGGYILQLDRHIKKVTAAEFKAAKQAGNP